MGTGHNYCEALREERRPPIVIPVKAANPASLCNFRGLTPAFF
jgi:hypothetical protein